MRSKAIITCSLLLASCGKSDDAATGGNGGNGFIQNIGGSTPHTPPPSQKDAIAALKILVNYQSEPVRFIFPIGNPSNCLEGMDGTAKIQACSVCVPVLKIILKQYPNKVLQKVKLEQEIFNIPFRRSISYEQPGI